MSAVQTAARRLARRCRSPPASAWRGYVVERNMTAFRRAWLLLLTGFAEPVFYLFSIGVGLGALVGDVTTDGGRTVPYAVFVAPALLAASAMNGAISDSTYNVFFKLKYQQLYDALLATPIGPRDIAVGEITWSLMRGSALLGDVPRRRAARRAGAVVVGAARAAGRGAHRPRLRRRSACSPPRS